MKYAILFTLNLYCASLYAQAETGTQYLETSGKHQPYFIIELNGANPIVYKMGGYLDKAGTGSSVLNTDTLVKQGTRTYTGKNCEFITGNGQQYLVVNEKKIKRYKVDVVSDVAKIYTTLNNAWYLDHYFALSKELNKTYPLNGFEFRRGFSSWKEMPDRAAAPAVFRQVADAKLQYIKDSVSSINNRYVLLTSHLLQSITAIDYAVLKDSLTVLPATFRYYSWYFGTVVNACSKQRPEYYFRLAEDLPQNRDVIFMAADDTKETVTGLKAVSGHDGIKKIFLKDRRFDKSMKYKIIGLYGALAGIILYFTLR